MKVADLGRRHGVSERSTYRWQSKYGGLEVSEAKRLKQLEEENRRMKMISEIVTAMPKLEPNPQAKSKRRAGGGHQYSGGQQPGPKPDPNPEPEPGW